MNVTACIPVLDQYSFTGPAVGWFTSPFSCVHLSAGVVFRVCVCVCLDVCVLFSKFNARQVVLCFKKTLWEGEECLCLNDGTKFLQKQLRVAVKVSSSQARLIRLCSSRL